MNREFLPFRIEADDSLSDNWFTQSPERLDKLRSDVTGKPKSVITLWAEEFKITPMEANLALEKGTGIFVTMETNSLDPATSVQFWLENALAKRNDLSANIWNGNRTKKYEVSAKKAREYSQLQDLSLASPEQELSALMVTLAKLEAIMPIMTKVYPGLQWNAVKESQLAMKQLLDKIGDDSKSSSKQNLALVATSGIVVITLILVAAPVKDDLCDPMLNRPLPDQHTNLLRDLAAHILIVKSLLHGRGAHQCRPFHIINNLGIDMFITLKHTQPGTILCPKNLFPYDYFNPLQLIFRARINSALKGLF